jgi:sulfur-carrier protein adenylyltransferase/sulfurtransferase
MKSVSVTELKQMMEDGVDFQLIDVREEHEFDEVNMNGLLMPMSEIINRLDEIRRDVKVVIHCKSGARSAAVVMALENNEVVQPFDNLYNLEGGILKWLEFNSGNKQ